MAFDEWPPAMRLGLGVLIAVGIFWLLGQILAVISFFWDIILLFFLAWLLAFTLRPIVDYFSKYTVPQWLTRRLHASGYPTWANRLSRWQLPRSGATILVYTAVVFLIIATLVFIIPIAVTQFGQLASRLPAYGADALAFFERLQTENPAWLVRLNSQAAQFGVNLEEAYSSLNIVDSVQTLGGRLAQNTLGIATSFAGVLTDLLLVLIISFYMTLDTPRLARWIVDMVPSQWKDECEILFQNIDRTFGGFIRSQLLMAVLSGLGTMLIMQFAGLGFVIIVSLFAGTIMLIPYVGAPIALFLPTLIALFQNGLTTAVMVFIAILALQQLILHIMMPRIMSETMGMHPLLVFLALLMGVRVAGFWGALFGIPVVGVIAAMLVYVYRRDILGTTSDSLESAPNAEREPEPEPGITAPAMTLEEQQTGPP